MEEEQTRWLVLCVAQCVRNSPPPDVSWFRCWDLIFAASKMLEEIGQAEDSRIALQESKFM
jgi:hypothetical protein